MVKFLKIRNVKDPQRERGNAGIDVFIPEAEEGFINDLKAKNPTIDITDLRILLAPGESVNIPTGLKTSFPENIALEAANKSGVATKKKFLVGASVVDSSYQGEIHAHVINVGLEPQTIKYGEKIVQFIPRLIDIEEHQVYSGITPEEFYNGVVTKRAEGGFGSTGSF